MEIGGHQFISREEKTWEVIDAMSMNISNQNNVPETFDSENPSPFIDVLRLAIAIRFLF